MSTLIVNREGLRAKMAVREKERLYIMIKGPILQKMQQFLTVCILQ
jgi:hypothetical protein